MAIELNDTFLRALNLLENTPKNIFITGKAGTGKSTLLEHFRTTTKKNIAVLAPTGVAAVNVKGQTIHSFFGFKPSITPDTVQKVTGRYGQSAELYKQLDTIVIDEISMVRADLLDCVDKFMRLNGPDARQPFGGVQMVFLGDLYQLPPVLTPQDQMILGERYLSPYFFDAHVFECLSLEIVELTKIYRQRDTEFIEILNAIRTKTASFEQLAKLNRQYAPDFSTQPGNFFIHLTSTNALADTINEEQLERLDGQLYVYQGQLNGEFAQKDTPTAMELAVKKGAQVMLLNNDPARRWVNGTIGKLIEVKKLAPEPDAFVIQLPDGNKIEVTPITWESHRFVLTDDGSIDTQVAGSFTQYPLKLAWAVTIHKSQGKTFDNVVIDIGRGTFAHGQMYVALSRCTTLEGIVLKQLIHPRHIIMDPRVQAFMNQFTTQTYFRGQNAIDAPQALF